VDWIAFCYSDALLIDLLTMDTSSFVDANDWQELGLETNWWGVRHMLSAPHHKILWQPCFSNKLVISFDIDHNWTN